MRTTPDVARRVAVGRHRHEVDLDRQVDGPGQVGHEHVRALEHADQQRRPAGVVGGDLLARARRPGAELVAVIRISPMPPSSDAERGHRGRHVYPAAIGAVQPQPPRGAGHPPPAADLAAPPRRRRPRSSTRSTAARVGRWVDARLVRATSARIAWAATGRRLSGQLGRDGRIDRRGQVVEQVGHLGVDRGRRGQHRAPRRARRCRRAAAAARGGPGCGGSAGRRWSGPRTASRPSAAHRARGSRPGAAPSSGRRRRVGAGQAGRARRRAAGRAARSRPGRRRCGRAARRAEQRRAGGAGPGLEVGPGLDARPAALEPARRTARPARRPPSASSAEPGAQPVVDVHRGDVAAGRDGQHQQRQRVGPARHRAARPRARRREACSGRAASAERRHAPPAARRQTGAIARPSTRSGSRISASVGRCSGRLEGPVEVRRCRRRARPPR